MPHISESKEGGRGGSHCTSEFLTSQMMPALTLMRGVSNPQELTWWRRGGSCNDSGTNMQDKERRQFVRQRGGVGTKQSSSVTDANKKLATRHNVTPCKIESLLCARHATASVVVVSTCAVH